MSELIPIHIHQQNQEENQEQNHVNMELEYEQAARKAMDFIEDEALMFFSKIKFLINGIDEELGENWMFLHFAKPLIEEYDKKLDHIIGERWF